MLKILKKTKKKISKRVRESWLVVFGQTIPAILELEVGLQVYRGGTADEKTPTEWKFKVIEKKTSFVFIALIPLLSLLSSMLSLLHFNTN